MGNDATADKSIEKLARWKTGRLNWENYWQEISEYVQPNFSNTFFTNGYALTQAQKKDQKRFDGAAEIALYRFAASMESMLTPRNSKWHALATDDVSLNMKPRVRAFFDDATDILFKYRYAPQANFASQCHEHYQALGFLGTGSMYVDKLSPRGFRYSTIHIAQVYFGENHQGIIEEAIRPFRLTARNALAKFQSIPGANIPEDLMKKANGPNPEEFVELIHCVEPNTNRDPRRKDWRGMKFVSYYIYVQSRETIIMEGFNSFPYAISRYLTAPGELYGRSPAMQCFTNIKVLNEQKKTVLKQGHRVVDPVLLAHDDGVLDGFSLRPGSINSGAINSRGQRMVDVLPTGNLSLGHEMMDMERKEINAAFMTDLFQILTDGPQMTATEVIEKAREKGALLSPTMGRQESEFLGPLIERELDLAVMQGLLPPMPPELLEAGGEYKIIYDSPLARAQKAEQAAGLMRTVGWAAEIAQTTQNPAPLDHFNWDVIIPELSITQAVPGRWMATPEQVQSLRQGRQEQIATQQVIQAGPTVAAMQKNSGLKSP